MRVLYIDVNCKNGSTGQIVYSLFSNCKENGIETAVCYGRGPKIKEKNIYKFGLDLETYLHAFLTRITGYTGCFSYFSTKRLINFIKRFNPDVVHIHELHAYFVNIKQLLSFLSKNKYKVVFTNHCEFLYTGKCGVAYPCTKFKTGCSNCPKLHSYPKSMIFDNTKKMYLLKKRLFSSFSNSQVYLTSPSNFLKQRMQESFLGTYRISVVNNCVDTNIFAFRDFDSTKFKTNYGIPLNKKIVLMVASNAMTDLKGGEKFIELSKRMKDLDFFFVLIGADREYTTENCMVISSIDYKQTISAFYNISYVSLILSSFESFSMISVESQCCGTPVIYFDVGGIPETIVDDCCKGVKYNDLDAIKQILTESNFSIEDKKRISKKAIFKFNKNNIFQEYLSVYKELLNEGTVIK